MYYLEIIAAIGLKVGSNVQMNKSVKLNTYQMSSGVVGWCDGAGQTSSAERPTIWITVGQGPTALAVGAGGGCLDIFTLIYPFFPLSPSLRETARYRLKYCLKGPLNPKPTNQPIKGQGHYLTFAKGHSEFKIRSCLSQKLLSHLEPNFI